MMSNQHQIFLRSKRWSIGLMALMIALFIFPVLAHGATERFKGKEVEAHKVLVKFKTVAPTAIFDLEQDEDVDEAEGVGGTGALLFHSRSKDVATLIGELSARPDVLYAEPDFIVHATAIPNDPRFSSLWGLRNTGQNIGCGTGCFGSAVGTAGADISASVAWDVSTGSRANVVAVVDTGIDYTHPDLAANVWSAPTAFTVIIGGHSITCAAGTHGFNALTNSCDPKDDNNHGTHVAGTIGAVGNNSVGVTGVNWTASIMGAKFLNAGGSGTLAGAINAIEFTIQAKAAFASSTAANVRILSNSWGGGGFSQALLDEINRANSNEMLFVAAAGNSSSNNDITPVYPASYNAPNVVAVAATDNTDALASFSNWGPTSVHLGAPGVDTLSTIIGGSYAYFSGTSMATPHVSGAAALVLSNCPLSTAALKSTLLNNVDLLSTLTDLVISGGRLNVNKAIRSCSIPPAPDFSISATPASSTVTAGSSTNYSVNVVPQGGFSGTVTFAVGGLPAGVSASFTPASVIASGSSTMTVNTATSTTAGSYPLTITATSGTSSHATSVVLVVTVPPAPQPPDFSLSIAPSLVKVTPGKNAKYTVTINRTGGFSGSVLFAITGLPPGASGIFVPNPASATSSTLTVTTSSTTPVGSYIFTVTGTSNSLIHTATSTLRVRQATATSLKKASND